MSVCFLTFSCAEKGQVDYGAGTNVPAVQTAVSEFLSLVEEARVGTNQAEDHYKLFLDSEISDGSFGYRRKGETIEFFAGDAMGLSNAMYTLLEDIGYTFDITGISKPDSYDFTVLKNADRRISPAVRWRGIRQHVNFPMDVSSYSIEDAKEYIDCVTRLRMNKFTIHAYPGQWYETHIGDSLSMAGNFFYGNKHYIYNNSLLKKVIPTNDSLYCIPQAEKLKGQALSSFTIDWMQQFMAYAKKRGFYIQLSFEPRSTSVAQAVSTAKEIEKQYPDMDALEFMTEETGGWGPACTKEETLATLDKYFTADIAKNATVLKPIREKQRDLNKLYEQIGICVNAIQEIRKEGAFGPELKLGIYSSLNDLTQGAYRLARLALPQIPVCLMPSHGSDGTALAFPLSVLDKEDMDHTEIYSWIEFDGLMYLEQNSIGGNETLIKDMAQMAGGQISSLCFNHWRTAENRTSTRYVAETSLTGSMPADTFYASYAKRLGITDIKDYTKALHMINEVDSYSKSRLKNIGFCWFGAWRRGGPYLHVKPEHMIQARDMHLEVANLLAEALKETEKGTVAHDYLAFKGNRALCTVLYLDAFVEATKLQSIKKNASGEISKADQKIAEEICNKSLLKLDQFLDMYARMMPDRGCEGTLSSVWNAPVQGLKVSRAKYSGVPMEEMPHSDDAIDAPPLPILYE